jgi:preprotein translocase subunit SecA
MRLFGSERLINIFENLGVPEGQRIQHKMLSSAIERAQEKIESNNFAIRKNLLEYDQVMNEQREKIYEQRKRVLSGEDMKMNIQAMTQDIITEEVMTTCGDEVEPADWDLKELSRVLNTIIPIGPLTKDELDGVKKSADLVDKIYDKAQELYSQKEAEFPEPEAFREVERVILLRVIDQKWMSEIDDMEQLKQSVGLQQYGQRNPVDVYKELSYSMMDEMNENIKHDTVQMLFHIRVEKKVEREEVAKETGTNKEDGPNVRVPKRRAAKKIYPNDPCPCGSGKKYKNCHGRFAE